MVITQLLAVIMIVDVIFNVMVIHAIKKVVHVLVMAMIYNLVDCNYTESSIVLKWL